VTEPIFDPNYWAARLAACGEEWHRSIFNGSIDQFSPLEDEHRRVLTHEIGKQTSVLDAGCGYGRILDVMPAHWRGWYLGVDLAPALVKKARQLHPNREFRRMDLRNLKYLGDKAFDVAIVCSVRPMVVRNAGLREWNKMERELTRVAHRLLFLTYGEWD
jgi:SAM-dependent methyltransferase